MRTWSFTTGHGTKNDFVLIMDRSGLLNPSDDDIRFLCDRHIGLGADGVLRAIKAGLMPQWDGDPDLWFMDYRNADGSIAEICANGLRVFARWLIDQDLAHGDGIDIATRAGVRHCRLTRDGQISVELGEPRWTKTPTTIELGGVTYRGHHVDVGNPHCVVELDTVEELEHLDLSSPPHGDDFLDGVNVEFIVFTSERNLRMRVHERGVGETWSCGSGVVAACCHAKNRENPPPNPQDITSYHVSVPGGQLSVDFHENQATLTGPAVIIAQGKVTLLDD
ncbi:MAG: diaminopimelate epimerase [Propionibacteriaceae bacterium]|nr:diaminopimelate epimerase [Propionibacteriaceae bacterium]